MSTNVHNRPAWDDLHASAVRAAKAADRRRRSLDWRIAGLAVLDAALVVAIVGLAWELL